MNKPGGKEDEEPMGTTEGGGGGEGQRRARRGRGGGGRGGQREGEEATDGPFMKRRLMMIGPEPVGWLEGFISSRRRGPTVCGRRLPHSVPGLKDEDERKEKPKTREKLYSKGERAKTPKWRVLEMEEN
jgi:hypothetical protein